MKTKLYYSLLIFLARPAICLFIAFEMFLLIFAANFALGQYNSRRMLYEPVQTYIEHQGFTVREMPVFSEPENIISEDRTGGETVIISEDIKTPKKLPKPSELLPDAEIMTLRHINLGELDITVLPDDVFDRLKLPTDDGSIFASGSESKNFRVIVTPNNKGCKAGDTVTLPQEYSKATEVEGGSVTVRVGDDITFEFAAVLTDPTYIMHFNYSYDMSYENLYLNYDSSYYRDQFFCYTCESEVKRSGIDDIFISEDTFSLVSFKNELSDGEYSAAKTKLEENGYTVTDNSLILENSRDKLESNLKTLLPAVFAFGIVVLIGIVSTSVIGAKTMLKKLAVFYCCGATKADCILVSVGQTVLISLIALVTSAGALAVFVMTKLSDKFGFVFRTNNIAVTAGIILGSILISAIAPTVLISKADPRELLTETTEE